VRQHDEPSRECSARDVPFSLVRIRHRGRRAHELARAMEGEDGAGVRRRPSKTSSRDSTDLAAIPNTASSPNAG
jgi:hypothetical protein